MSLSRPAYTAHARARFGLASLAPISRLFDAVLKRMKFGVHRGGDCNGEEVECSWHLLAEGDDGPFIPSMAIEGSAIIFDPEASKADSPAPVQSHVAEPFTRISRGFHADKTTHVLPELQTPCAKIL